MGLSAVLPIIGQIIFLAQPVKARAAVEEAPPEEGCPGAPAPGGAAPAPGQEDIQIVSASWQPRRRKRNRSRRSFRAANSRSTSASSKPNSRVSLASRRARPKTFAMEIKTLKDNHRRRVHQAGGRVGGDSGDAQRTIDGALSPTFRKSNSIPRPLEIPHHSHVRRARFGQGHARENSRGHSRLLSLQLRRGVPQPEPGNAAGENFCRILQPRPAGAGRTDHRVVAAIRRTAWRPPAGFIPSQRHARAGRHPAQRASGGNARKIRSTSSPCFTCAAPISRTWSRACSAARSRTTAWTTPTWTSSARA